MREATLKMAYQKSNHPQYIFDFLVASSHRLERNSGNAIPPPCSSSVFRSLSFAQTHWAWAETFILSMTIRSNALSMSRNLHLIGQGCKASSNHCKLTCKRTFISRNQHWAWAVGITNMLGPFLLLSFSYVQHKVYCTTPTQPNFNLYPHPTLP